MATSVEDKVIQILADQALLEKDDIKPGLSPADIGIDSLGLVEVIFAIEEAFDINVPFNANEPDKSEFDISNVEAIVGAVQGLVDAQKA